MKSSERVAAEGASIVIVGLVVVCFVGQIAGASVTPLFIGECRLVDGDAARALRASIVAPRFAASVSALVMVVGMIGSSVAPSVVGTLVTTVSSQAGAHNAEEACVQAGGGGDARLRAQETSGRTSSTSAPPLMRSPASIFLLLAAVRGAFNERFPSPLSPHTHDASFQLTYSHGRGTMRRPQIGFTPPPPPPPPPLPRPATSTPNSSSAKE